ncbi:MAG TPA: FAD-dependent oxidoreductase, partial [Proteobacteria bacterium]|nr:FAD-dependent oxidoreductase [Pseudomonadota bacterium]
MSHREPVVIIGAGLAGLSAARALRRADVEVLVLERENRVGGLCRTETVDGFAFDYTGHLLHLREGRVRDMIIGELAGKLTEHVRNASVFLKETYVPFPIQANFGSLRPNLVKRCIRDFRRAAKAVMPVDPSFVRWARAQFGDTLAELFMIPYNRKLYIHPLEEMEPSWTSWSVPRPTAEEMEMAARGEDPGTFGYNAAFYYPTHGGIEMLPGMLSGGLDDIIALNTGVVRIDAERKVVTTDDGREIGYRSLISTTPLPALLEMVTEPSWNSAGIPAGGAKKLRHSSVVGYCLGLDGPVLRDEHWIYFPEANFPFYRVGVFTNFSADLAPEGASSLYVEVAHRPGEPPGNGSMGKQIMEGLKSAGIIPPGRRVVARRVLAMPYAYVFYDRNRKDHLDGILAGLREHSILSVGRYGAWEYSAMEDA